MGAQLAGKMMWSPNGQKIAISGYDEHKNDIPSKIPYLFPYYGLYVYDLNATQYPAKLHQILDNTTRVDKFAWSPDGKYLAYTKFSPDKSAGLFLASPPTYDDVTQLTDYIVYDFAWSPDGKRLLITASPPSRAYNRIRIGYILSLDDLSLTRVTYEPYSYVWLVGWSPDGKYIAFAYLQPQSGNAPLFISNIVYETSTLKLYREFKNKAVSWSPDGNHAVLSSLVSLCDSDLNTETTIFDMTDRPRDFFIDRVKWSPDGKYVTYNADWLDSNESSLYLANLDGSTKEITRRQQTGEFGHLATAYAWSPDSRYLLFVKYEYGHYNFYIADVQRGELKRFIYDFKGVGLDIAWQPVEVKDATILSPISYSPDFDYSWEFDQDGIFEDWGWGYQDYQTVDLDALEIKGGYLIAKTTGTDPQISSPEDLNIEATKFSKIEIRMRVSAGESAQLFFSPGDSGMSERNSIIFEIKPGSEFHTYVIDLHKVAGWKGIINQLRLDPTSDVIGETVEIDYIRLLP